MRDGSQAASRKVEHYHIKSNAIMDEPYVLPGQPVDTIFPLGTLVVTTAAADGLPKIDVAHALRQHAAGSWGDLLDDDRVANEMALKNGRRLFSAYKSTNGIKFWIITEADRSATTVLLPDDY